MFIFPVIIIISITLYIYYKVSILKTKDEVTQLYFNARSRICLGAFVLAFGINHYATYQSRLSLFFCIVFIILGSMQIVRGFNESRHYQNEYRKLNP